MTLLLLMMLHVFLWTDASIRFSMQHPLPFMYPRTTCTQSHAMLYYLHTSLGYCEQLCQYMGGCNAINYNPTTRLCTLQDNTTSAETNIEERSADAPVDCISLTVLSTDVAGAGSEYELCKEHTCNETNMCVPLVDTSSYKCVKQFCPPPSAIAHASHLMTSAARIGSRNAYICDAGYTTSSQAVIQCDNSGAWTSTDLVCHPNCPDIPVKEGAALLSWYPHRLFANTTVQYTCKPGYYNLTRSTVVCDEDGRWSEFECFPYCYQSQLPVLENGVPLIGDKYTVNMTAEYACNGGYYLSPGSPLLFCDVTGMWSNLQVTCYKHCLEPENPAGGVLPQLRRVMENGVPMIGDKYTVNTTAEYACSGGYYLSPGSPLRFCDVTGTWSDLQVTCFKHCLEPGNPANGVISTLPDSPYVDGSTATFKCHDRYYSYPRDVDRSAICRSDGTWSYLVKCFRYCDDLPGTPTGCAREFVSTGAPYTVDTYVTYKGWHFALGLTHIDGNGNNQKTCNKHGDWSGLVVCCFEGFCYMGECVSALFNSCG